MMTAAAFGALGLALLLCGRIKRFGSTAAQILSLFSGLIVTISITGYIYHAHVLPRIFLYTKISLNVATGLWLLSSATFLLRGETGIAGDLTSGGTGGVMARRLLPAVFVIQLFLGWICLQGLLATLYGPGIGLALYASMNTAVFAMLIWATARHMNREHANKESASRAMNLALEQRVSERTIALQQQATLLAEQAALLDLGAGRHYRTRHGLTHPVLESRSGINLWLVQQGCTGPGYAPVFTGGIS